MIDKKHSRIRRAQATRVRIGLQRMNRLAVHRTNLNIYASVLSPDGGRVLVSASTLEQEVRNQLSGAKGRGETPRPRRSSAPGSPTRRLRPGSIGSRSTVPVFITTAGSRCSPMRRARPD